MASLPQTSLAGARAGTAVPQTTQPQLNPNKMNNQIRNMQNMGTPTAQAVNTAAQNPSNTFAKGGVVDPPSPDEINKELSLAQSNNSSEINDVAGALAGEPVMKENKTKPTENQQNGPAANSSDSMENMFKEYEDKDYQTARSKLKQQDQHYAKGGDVHEQIKNMSLKDIIKMLASHPGLSGMGEGDSNAPMKSTDMKMGGPIAKNETNKHGNGLLNMNVDVPTYAQGGFATAGFNPKNNPNVAMAGGGTLEQDSITGYAADGTPIIQNPDGTQQYGDVNQLLGRPENAPTLGTGQTPVTGISKNAANSVAQAVEKPQGMAEGGEEGPPAGSLKEEVADDIPAKLSTGEFVFSADVVRFFGLQKLTAMMDFARDQLSHMSDDGTIRHPGDGKNKGVMGEFMQDEEPNEHAYEGKETPKEEESEMAEGGEAEQGNINLHTRPVVHNDDNTISTVKSMSFNEDGKEILVPTISPGGKKLSNEDAIKLYHQTGQHLGKFNTVDEANSYAQQLHNDQAKEYQGKKKGGPIKLKLAEGGDIDTDFEEEFKKGGQVEPYGRDNMVSSHPKMGAVTVDYDKGGVVGAKLANLNPKKLQTDIPAPKIKLATTGVPRGPNSQKYGIKKYETKMKKGGLLSTKIPEQTMIGA